LFSGKAWEQYGFWLGADRRLLKKLNSLIEDCRHSPFAGIAKPEPLRGELAGYWSRQMDDEHRLIYAFRELDVWQSLVIVQCRFHY
jgi:toxin YoeB